MAMTLKLVRLDDFTADIDAVDLTSGGYSLALDGYQPAVAADGDNSVSESITINIQSTSVDALATLVQALDKKIRQVGWWINDQGIEKYQVWLRVGLNGETNTRQAMLLSVKPPDSLPLFNRLIDNNNLLASYAFAIERTPFWEGAPITEVNKTGINSLGGSTALSAAVNGDVPARLQKFKVKNTGSYLSTVWAGWKSSRFGTAANFAGRWGLNSGIYGIDTSASGDGTASTGARITTTFSTDATLIYRVHVPVSHASANQADQRGTFLVLMRAKMSDTTSIARARMTYSLNLSQQVYRSRIPISGTSWQLYEMGVVKNPPVRTYEYNNPAAFYISIYAERYSGAGALHMDCLVLIPIDDGAIKASTSGTSLSGATNEKIVVFQAADDSVNGVVENSSDPYYPITLSPQNGWQLPADTSAPYLVVAGTDFYYGSTNGNTLNVDYIYIPRFRTLRGNVT